MASANDQTLDAKLDSLDDHLNPLEGTDDKSTTKEEATKEDTETEDTAEEGKETKESKQSEESDETADTDVKGGDEGYAIDDEDESTEQEADKPEDKPGTSNLTPEQQYIIDGLQPIKIKGVVGDSGKTEEFSVYAPEQLPAGFKYLDDRDAASANKAFAMLETRAEKLQSDFRQQQTDTQAKDFKEREDNADRSDIGDLQRAGDIPRFKVEPSDPKFTSDPASKLIQDVLDFKEKTNDDYVEQYNAGRPYRHIGFKEAFRLYNLEHPAEDTAQKKEDDERKDFSRRTAETTDTSTNINKPRVHAGTSSRDLDALIENLDWVQGSFE